MKLIISTGRLKAFALAPMFLFFAASAHGAYTQPASTVAGGGGLSSSASYSNIGVIGQPGIVGSSASASYGADHGFLPVLGGWRILYPVISANPGTLSFTLLSGSSDSQGVEVSNAGGGTLSWSVAKDDPGETYFTVSPSSGTGNASINVTANTSGLGAGTYSDILTISGAGIGQTVQVQLALTVSMAGSRLTVTVVGDTAGKGGGSVVSSPDGINCAGAGTSGTTCYADFPPGTTVTLMQTPDSNSTMATWSPTGCSGEDCQVVMGGDRQVTATFPYAYMAKVNSSGNRYDTLGEALSGASSTDTILARAATFTGNFTVTGKAITLLGGRSTYYLPLNDWTVLQSGVLTVQSGSLTVERLEIK